MARFALEAALADLRLRLAGMRWRTRLAAAAAGRGWRCLRHRRPASDAGRRRSVRRTAVVGRRIDVESTRTSAGRDIDDVVADRRRPPLGARLVKLKIEPGWDRAPADRAAGRAPRRRPGRRRQRLLRRAAVRPRSTGSSALELAYLEQPLDPDDLVGHARLQARARCARRWRSTSPWGRRGCWPPRWRSARRRRFSLKPSRLGGLPAPARAAAHHGRVLRRRDVRAGRGAGGGRSPWPSLDVARLPTDLGPSARYVDEDVTEPVVLDGDGDLIVPDGPGIGVDVRAERVAALASEVVELRP